MNEPRTAREALVLEALGEAARLMQLVEAVVPALEQSRQSLAEARLGLASELRSFEGRIAALSEKARIDIVQHIVARTEEATRRAIEEQCRAMAEAARIAFAGELRATVLRLQNAVEGLLERRPNLLEGWLARAAQAAAVASATWALMTLVRTC